MTSSGPTSCLTLPHHPASMPSTSPPSLSSSSSSAKRPAKKKSTAPRHCQFPNCTKAPKPPGRFCISHGGGKRCAMKGCTTSAVSRGFCVAHGGGRRCQHPGCPKGAQTGGLCWAHGGGKMCQVEGCSKRAQSGGACIAHGGGKRCVVENCTKVVQYNGLCVGHGGFRRCFLMSCEKKALANGYCRTHGGQTECSVADCTRKALWGGLCAHHKPKDPKAAPDFIGQTGQHHAETSTPSPQVSECDEERDDQHQVQNNEESEDALEEPLEWSEPPPSTEHRRMNCRDVVVAAQQHLRSVNLIDLTQTPVKRISEESLVPPAPPIHYQTRSHAQMWPSARGSADCVASLPTDLNRAGKREAFARHSPRISPFPSTQRPRVPVQHHQHYQRHPHRQIHLRQNCIDGPPLKTSSRETDTALSNTSRFFALEPLTSHRLFSSEREQETRPPMALESRMEPSKSPRDLKEPIAPLDQRCCMLGCTRFAKLENRCLIHQRRVSHL